MIKAMTINDYEALFVMWKDTPNMGLRTLDDSREGILRFLKRNPGTSFAAYEGNQLIGAILCGHDGRRGYIYHTAVLPEYRGQGIASGLVDAAVGALQREGITRVCLNVMETNEQGKQFWTKKAGRRKIFWDFTVKRSRILKICPCLRCSGYTNIGRGEKNIPLPIFV